MEKQLASSPDSVPNLLKQANKNDHNCVRATLLEANLHMSAGNYRKALKTLHRIEQQSPLNFKLHPLANRLDCDFLVAGG